MQGNNSQISKITDRIYLSGTGELTHPNASDFIRNNDIRLIISCIGQEYAAPYHQRLKQLNPNLQMVYLPYNDIPNENLWRTNNGDAKFVPGNWSNPMGRYVKPGIWDNYTRMKRYAPHKLNQPLNYSHLENDHNIYDNLPMLDIGYHWMDQVFDKSNGSVLIHCMAGISRSTSLIIYYLMKKYGVSYDQAYRLIKAKRPIIQPNVGFESQLRTYDKLRHKMVHNL